MEFIYVWENLKIKIKIKIQMCIAKKAPDLLAFFMKYEFTVVYWLHCHDGKLLFTLNLSQTR